MSPPMAAWTGRLAAEGLKRCELFEEPGEQPATHFQAVTVSLRCL
jgi:hypothetical protein